MTTEAQALKNQQASAIIAELVKTPHTRNLLNELAELGKHRGRNDPTYPSMDANGSLDTEETRRFILRMGVGCNSYLGDPSKVPLEFFHAAIQSTQRINPLDKYGVRTGGDELRGLMDGISAGTATVLEQLKPGSCPQGVVAIGPKLENLLEGEQAAVKALAVKIGSNDPAAVARVLSQSLPGDCATSATKNGYFCNRSVGKAAVAINAALPEGQTEVRLQQLPALARIHGAASQPGR